MSRSIIAQSDLPNQRYPNRQWRKNYTPMKSDVKLATTIHLP